MRTISRDSRIITQVIPVSKYQRAKNRCRKFVDESIAFNLFIVALIFFSIFLLIAESGNFLPLTAAEVETIDFAVLLIFLIEYIVRIWVSGNGVVERHVHVLHDPLRLFRAQLAALHALLRIALEPLEGAVERGLRHVDEMKGKVGKRSLEVIADVRPDRACPNDDDTPRQRPRGLVQ